ARSGKVQVAGWRRSSGEGTLEVLGRLADGGVARVLFTDIERDGTLLGPNLEAIREVLEALRIPVIASGGVGSLEDLSALARLAPLRLEGAVVGKALYSGALGLEKALQLTAAPVTRG
ncbi:MAG: HisA/HisF-related TIM barrel protein, partial [Actinomycetota bacterium]